MAREIPLNGKYGQGKVAIVDDQDFGRIAQYTWHVDTEGYVRTKIQGKVTKLHRFIMNALPRQVVDHANGNVLDNRRQNLRFATKGQNKMNAATHKNSIAGVKGVSQRETGKYQARIQVNDRQTHLGCFYTLRAAAHAYNCAAVKYFGEYALINDLSLLPDEIEPSAPKPTSVHRGVSWDSRRSKWRASMQVNRQRYELGMFDTEIEAAQARAEAESAFLNT